MSERGCYCLCGVNHPQVTGVCLGHSDDLEIAFDSQITGRVDVAMCNPCAVATLASVKREDDE